MGGARRCSACSHGLPASVPARQQHPISPPLLQGCGALTDEGMRKLGCLRALASLNLSECAGGQTKLLLPLLCVPLRSAWGHT